MSQERAAAGSIMAQIRVTFIVIVMYEIHLWGRCQIYHKTIACYRNFYYLCNENPRPGLRIDANHILTLTRINHTAGEEPTSWQMRIYCAEVYDWRCKDTKNLDMKIIELLKFNKELLERLKNAGIRMEDCQYVELYSDFENMRKTDHQKVTYIVEKMAEKYNISVRKVYQLIRFFNSDCTAGAA